METTQKDIRNNKEKELALKIAEAMLKGDIPALMSAQAAYNEYRDRPIEATKKQPKQRLLEKYCACCGKMKYTTDFHKRAASSDGLQPRCKPCNLRARNNNKYTLIVPVEVDGIESDHRYCKMCEDLKPLDEFPSSGRGGKKAQCKQCYSKKIRKGKAMKKALAEKRNNGNVS
ncbi:hypothetical protein [Bacillus cereus]|uniref:Uncharacterized protein n=1 Tax=Bacillus cereus HuA2-1 TaxID=1053201 RepID=J9CHG6_BACCE|nr:hypothetical protein [Bacillus cereus]EJS13679.1 hypothetical protein IKS_02803 [Bacillus cereus VDM062]EJV84837.1 hypothetical protein IG3_02447 [Bacillus cereus HuA2-1]